MALTIGTVRFPWSIFCAPGARGFYGEGYWFHPLARLLGLTWRQTVFVAKTTTVSPRKGNMPLGPDGISPAELFPRCIIVKPVSGHVLNAVGLSGPGAVELLQRNIWQEFKEPFVLSFMAVAGEREDRLDEYRSFVSVFEPRLSSFKAPFALQLNFGCPNVELSHHTLYTEISEALQIVSKLGVPIVPNFNPLVPIELLLELEQTGLCQGFWIANTIPYDVEGLGAEIFGREISPLLQRGDTAGGISGPRCLPYTLESVRLARQAGVKLPIVAGNGIQSAWAVRQLAQAGANGVAIGCVAMMRTWRMGAIIREAHTVFDGKGEEQDESGNC